MGKTWPVVTTTLAAMGVVASLTACTTAPSAMNATPPQRSASASATPLDSAPRGPMPSKSPPVLPAVVVLDPGHNGGNASAPDEINRPVPAGGFTKPCNTTGTATGAGYPEHAFTFDVAVRTAELLRADGVTVVLTRTDDAGVGPCVNVRAALANDAEADLAVSIHADGAAAGARGFHVIEPALARTGVTPASSRRRGTRRPTCERRSARSRGRHRQPTQVAWWSPVSPGGTTSRG